MKKIHSQLVELEENASSHRGKETSPFPHSPHPSSSSKPEILRAKFVVEKGAIYPHVGGDKSVCECVFMHNGHKPKVK